MDPVIPARRLQKMCHKDFPCTMQGNTGTHFCPLAITCSSCYPNFRAEEGLSMSGSWELNALHLFDLL